MMRVRLYWLVPPLLLPVIRKLDWLCNTVAVPSILQFVASSNPGGNCGWLLQVMTGPCELVATSGCIAIPLLRVKAEFPSAAYQNDGASSTIMI